MKEKMNKIEEIRLRSCVCEQVKEWARYFNVSEEQLLQAKVQEFASATLS